MVSPCPCPLTRSERRAPKIKPPRDRRDWLGKLVQIHSSDRLWFEQRTRCWVFIEDSTRRLMQLRFVPTDLSFATFEATRVHVEAHGKQVGFYSDQASISADDEGAIQRAPGHAIRPARLPSYKYNNKQDGCKMQRMTLPIASYSSPLSGVPIKGAGIPLHRQLFLCLRDRIFRGVYVPGSVIPNEQQLCELFDVSRITVRRALADLEAKGLLVRKQRLGTFVHPDFQPARQTSTLAFLDGMQSTALEAMPSEMLTVEKALPPPDIASLLKLDSGQPAHHTRRLRSENGTPVVFSEAWVPALLLPKVTESAARKNLIYQLLLAQGIIFDRVVQEISAEAADPESAALLRTEIGAPLLRVTRLLHDTQHRPIQHLTAKSSPDRTRMLMDLSAATIGSLSAGTLAHV